MNEIVNISGTVMDLADGIYSRDEKSRRETNERRML